ncbi:hypothetical protein CON32_00275 [Bacillus cereus]|uniref:hypothetical protein n=1 Tax=Bacillus paranthracis TaxID=2026186 RepID=UPI000BECE35D|nr:hypothetical protein CON32_00275 [Bacillus cereus]
MQERIDELNAEMEQAMDKKRILENFIAESIINKQEIPEVVLVTLGEEIRRLKRVVKDCKFRLETYK